LHWYAENKIVFNKRLKLSVVRSGSRRLSGKEFQAIGPATARAIYSSSSITLSLFYLYSINASVFYKSYLTKTLVSNPSHLFIVFNLPLVQVILVVVQVAAVSFMMGLLVVTAQLLNVV